MGRAVVFYGVVLDSVKETRRERLRYAVPFTGKQAGQGDFVGMEASCGREHFQAGGGVAHLVGAREQADR